VGTALVSHCQGQTAIFPVLGAHFVGMFGLFLLVSPIIARVGRRRALAGGLLLLGASTLAVAGTLDSVLLTSVALFGVGLGWNLAYVAATTDLAERASPKERGKVLGLSDLLSGLVGAGLTVGAGFALAAAGIAVVAVGGALLATVSALVLLGRHAQPT